MHAKHFYEGQCKVGRLTKSLKIMLAQNIQSLLNLFSYCAFHLFRNHSSDLLSSSSSLADHLILTQSNPLILENLDSSFVYHRYFILKKSDYRNKSARVSQWYKFRLPTIRVPCHILLLDFNGISRDTWVDKKRRLRVNWKVFLLEGLLVGLGGWRESSNLIIFEDSYFSSQSTYFTFFTSVSHIYAVKSPYIFLTNSQILLFCKTCPTQLMELNSEQLQSSQELHLYWKQIHKNLHLAPVLHAPGPSKRYCISNRGRKDVTAIVCACITLSRKYNYSSYFHSEPHPPSDQLISYAMVGAGSKEQITRYIGENKSIHLDRYWNPLRGL